VCTVVSHDISFARAIAVDWCGNVYIADSGNNSIEKWTAATDTVCTLADESTGLDGPGGIAVDGAGNVYFSNSNCNKIEKWTAATQTLCTVVSTGLCGPGGIALDHACNIYIADSGHDAIKKQVELPPPRRYARWPRQVQTRHFPHRKVPHHGGVGRMGAYLFFSGASAHPSIFTDDQSCLWPHWLGDRRGGSVAHVVDPSPKFEGSAAGSDSLLGYCRPPLGCNP